ncbi:MAG: hypothetical protein R6V04_06995 [bacterium]
MINPRIKKEILEQLDHLKFEQQNQILQYINNLTHQRKHSVNGKKLLDFAGEIDEGDLKIISDVIEQGCEKVNPDEW